MENEKITLKDIQKTQRMYDKQKQFLQELSVKKKTERELLEESLKEYFKNGGTVSKIKSKTDDKTLSAKGTTSIKGSKVPTRQRP